MIFIKTKEEIIKMRGASAIVLEVLSLLTREVAPGVSTWELDKVAENYTLEHGATPAFKGYKDFPASVCFAINNEIVHGIPSKDRVLREGDIVSMDFGAVVDGYYGDSAVTVPVGEVSPDALRLLEVTRESLYKGIENATTSNRLLDVSKAIQEHVERAGFSVVTAFVGHGIGRNLHEEPQVPNFVPSNSNWGRGMRLKSGMVIAIEPMVNMGGPDVEILDDGWTAITKDGSLSAHFEHTVAITDNGPMVLTAGASQGN